MAEALDEPQVDPVEKWVERRYVRENIQAELFQISNQMLQTSIKASTFLSSTC